MILTMPRGGVRENAGRKSAFPGLDLRPFAMDFTPDGRRALDVLRIKTGLSRNNILAHLTREYAETLTFDTEGIVFPGKAQDVLAIRMPPAEGALLRTVHDRTGKSYSDIGEALVLRYGDSATFPVLPGADRRRRRRAGRRRAKSGRRHRPDPTRD